MINELLGIQYNIAKANATDGKVQNLASYINAGSLKAIHKAMDKNKASGIDRVTKEEYGRNLEENLENLVKRMKSGSYSPNPTRRVYIPKETKGKMRPLGISCYEDKLVENAKTYGYAKTMFGRRRPIPELSSSNFMQRSFGERVAMNSPIQGTAADIIKLAMIHVWARLRREKLRSRLILQVHDELLIEVCAQEEEQVRRILSEEMQAAAKLSVALEIDLHTGMTWYDAKL